MNNLIGLALFGLFPLIPSSTITYEAPKAEYAYYQPTHEQEVWLKSLQFCESKGKPEALNPEDGGSPSFGILQFKKSTFNLYRQKYGIPEADIYDIKTQEEIAYRMLLNEKNAEKHWLNCSKVLKSQFPASGKTL